MYNDFKCKKCGIIKEVSWKISIGSPSEVLCECGEKMQRIWGSSNIIIPDHMSATREDEYVRHLGNKLKHSHPSDDYRKSVGKSPRGKIYY